MSKPEVSLLLCTRNRAKQLKVCLEYISRQNTSRRWELLVVDNGSTDETKQVLTEFAAEVPFPVKILHETRAGKGRGLNLAVRESRGDVIALIDDDCYVAPDYVDRVQAIFADPRIGFAGGRVELFDRTDYPITIRTSTASELLPPRSYVETGWILGANMMFRHSVLEAIGGFDPEMGPGTPFYADDPDVQARASFAGWWGLYTPDVVVAHHHRRKAKDIPALRRTYSTSTGSYMMKFLLMSETRSTYLRAWYWTFVRTLSGRYAVRDFLWEVQGAAAYLAFRLRKRLTSSARQDL